MTHREKRTLIDRKEKNISLSRQVELLGISRSSLYYEPRKNNDQEMMNRIDEIYTEYPFYGSRRIRLEFSDRYGIDIGREHIRRLMKTMGIEAVYPKKNPHTSQGNPKYQTYPYLLKHIDIHTPNQVWGTDITYIRLSHGFAYLVALIDWHSRYVLSWRLSASMETTFCLDALQEALRLATPEIHNSDQGAQFTDRSYVALLETNGVKVSMDGRGRCMDNIFTERLWRTVKYENVYLRGYRDMTEAREGLNQYFSFYNEKRRHQSLGYRTPISAYLENR